MASATPDLRLPSQPRGITALLPVPNYTAWWQRNMCVNNLPKVVTQQCPGAESNLRLWVTSGLQVRHVTIKLPRAKMVATANERGLTDQRQRWIRSEQTPLYCCKDSTLLCSPCLCRRRSSEPAQISPKANSENVPQQRPANLPLQPLLLGHATVVWL